jgi:hypothetical protein
LPILKIKKGRILIPVVFSFLGHPHSDALASIISRTVKFMKGRNVNVFLAMVSVNRTELLNSSKNGTLFVAVILVKQ